MKRDDAKRILPLVDNHIAFDALLHYVDLRTKTLTDSLLYCDTLEAMKATQQTIQELRRFKTLREEVKQSEKDG